MHPHHINRYPVRNEENWDIELVRKKNRAAMSKLADLEALGCSHEPCKGWAGTRANDSGADAHRVVRVCVC